MDSYGTLIILSSLLFIKDLCTLVLWLSRCLGTSWTLPFSPMGRSVGIVTLSLVLGAWSTWQAVRVPEVRTVEIQLPRMDSRLDGFSIVHLSDLHIGTKPMGGCLGCGKCEPTGRCAFPDRVKDFLDLAETADGFVFGSPVHYAAAAGAMAETVINQLAAKLSHRQ